MWTGLDRSRPNFQCQGGKTGGPPSCSARLRLLVLAQLLKARVDVPTATAFDAMPPATGQAIVWICRVTDVRPVGGYCRKDLRESLGVVFTFLRRTCRWYSIHVDPEFVGSKRECCRSCGHVKHFTRPVPAEVAARPLAVGLTRTR